MEIKDLSKLLIKELPYYSPSASYASTFKTHKIKTVDQLFDEGLINGIISRSYNEKSKDETRALVALAEAEFFHKPLPNDKFLSQKIVSYKKDGERDYYVDLRVSKNKIKTISLDDLCYEMVMGSPYCGGLTAVHVIKNNVDVRKKFKSGELRVIDFMKIILDSDESQFELRFSGGRVRNATYRTIINSYTYQHSKNKKIKMAPGAIKILKKQLTELNKVMAELEVKRNVLEQQISDYEELLSSNEEPNENKKGRR